MGLKDLLACFELFAVLQIRKKTVYSNVMVVLQGIIGCTCDSKLYCARAVSWKNASVLQIKIWNSFCVHMAIVNQSGFFLK